MISATSRFSAVFIVGALIAGGAFYFAYINFNHLQLPGEEKKETKVVAENYADATINFQYPSSMTINAHASPADSRVQLIDVQAPGQKATDPIPLRIEILPKQTKVACDKLGGTAGNPIAVGITNVQPCFIPNTSNEGTTLRIEVTRENFSALFLSERYDIAAIADEVNGILATVTWNKQ